MDIIIRDYTEKDAESAAEVWNGVVKAGQAFPQTDELDTKSANEFFRSQSKTAVAVDSNTEKIIGLYILHPNNVGRCGHICNASFAVDESARGEGIGGKLVKHCLKSAGEIGFKILQFNAVVKENLPARHLYEKLGFVMIGEVPGGFKADDGYKDICLYYHTL